MDPGRRYGTVYSGSFVVGADLPDPCPYANDTLCDVPSLCAAGDYADCGTARPADVVLGFSMRCGDGELVQLTFDAYDGCAVFLAVPDTPAPAALPLPFLPSPLHPVRRTHNALGSRYAVVRRRAHDRSECWSDRSIVRSFVLLQTIAGDVLGCVPPVPSSANAARVGLVLRAPAQCSSAFGDCCFRQCAARPLPPLLSVRL